MRPVDTAILCPVCGYRSRNKVDAFEHERPHLVAMRRALCRLEQWDMLTLNAEGRGAATADAPWARLLIANVLDGEPNGELEIDWNRRVSP